MAELTVLEYPYTYAAWRVHPEDHEKVESERNPFSGGKRAVDVYHLHRLYEKAGIPHAVLEVTGEEYPERKPHEAIPMSFANQCKEALVRGDKILIASGYCAFAPAIAGGIQQALGMEKRIGVVWMDAHSDNKIVEKTKSSDLRFVGFPLSTMVGQTMEEWRKEFCLLEKPCRGCDVLLSDARCTGPEGLENLKDAGITLVSEAEFEDHENWRKRVDQLAQQVDMIFLMVDADILKSEWIPAYFRQEPGGHDLACVTENIRIVMRTGKVAVFSCFCVDFDKYEQGGERTYLSGMELIRAGLEAWNEQGEKR